MSEIRKVAAEALAQLARAAMGSGVACFAERLRAGQVDPAAPISEAFGDFPRDFIETRRDLADAVLDAVTPLIRAEVLREAASRLTSGDDFAVRSGTNNIDAYDHGVIAAGKRLREWAAELAPTEGGAR